MSPPLTQKILASGVPRLLKKNRKLRITTCPLCDQISTTLLSQAGKVCFALLQVTACRILSVGCHVSICLGGAISCQLPVCQSCYCLPRGIFLYKLPLLLTSKNICWAKCFLPLTPPRAQRTCLIRLADTRGANGFSWHL